MILMKYAKKRNAREINDMNMINTSVNNFFNNNGKVCLKVMSVFDDSNVRDLVQI